MSESGGDFADEIMEMVSEGANNVSAELRKRRSTRIVQAVPLVVTGVDALGRPFVERTSSLIINCHGCRYQSKHYVLKNMWVTMEIPHPETGQPPRTVRGRVAWIQRPRTVRQLFQVALELEVPGNAWGIAFPPEDWFAFPDTVPVVTSTEAAPETPQLPSPVPEPEDTAVLSEAELPTVIEADNLRVFPSPTNTTDASLQLARQVARLVADAKQQLLAASREAASQAVSAERRLSFEQWEQKFAAGREEFGNEAARAIEKFQQEADEHSRTAHAAGAEALRTELPRWLAPQLEQLTRDLTAKLIQEATAQRNEQTQQLTSTSETLKMVCQQAEETAARVKAHAEQSETQIAARAEAASQALDEAAKQCVDAIAKQLEALNTAASTMQQQITGALNEAQASWHGQFSSGLEAAQARLRRSIESALAEAQDRAAGGLNEHLRGLISQLQEEMAGHVTAVRESAAGAVAESEQRTAAIRDALQEHSRRLESVLARASETSGQLEQQFAQLEKTQQQALAAFQAQIETVLSPHREEMQRRSAAMFEEINGKIHMTFEEACRQSLARFDRQVEEMVQPHVTRAGEAVHRLAGGRSLLDAALTLQQDRIRVVADEAFAESLVRFQESLATVEQILQDSSQAITGRSLTELEAKVSDLKHEVVEELFKSAEWYEKKAQTQMEEVVRDAFERARTLFAEAADTTVAAFTDEIQRTGRQELQGFNEELQRSTDGARAELDAARVELGQRLTAEQEDFLRRYQEAMSGALESGVAEAQKKVSEGFGPLLASWKTMTDAHQKEMQNVYGQMGELAAEQHKKRLENVSNQWMLATVASLDHQSREMISAIAAAAEEKLREACAQVFAGVGESMRERLKEIAQSFTPAAEAPARAKSANTSA